MQSMLVRLLGLTFLALAALGGPARADSIDFSYTWTVLPGPVFTGTNPESGNGMSTGSVVVTAAPAGTSTATLNSLSPAFIAGAEITTTSSATGLPDSFSTPFQLQLELTDTLSGQSTTMLFSGTIAGELTATTSTLTSTFTSPASQSAVLGGREYFVAVDPMLANLPIPGSPTPALINATVVVNDREGGDTPIQETPEPGTLLLGAAALGGLAVRRWLRRS